MHLRRCDFARDTCDYSKLDIVECLFCMKMRKYVVVVNACGVWWYVIKYNYK